MNACDCLPAPISESPRVYMVDGFASAREIDHALALYGGETPRADLRVAWDTGLAGRSGELPVTSDPVLGELATRIETMLGFATGLPDQCFRFRRYAPGDYHPAHVDCHEIAGQHLVATALVYLTDALDGGETVFPEALPGPLVFAARRGRLAIWFNYTPDGQVDRRSRHRSEILRRGTKSTLAYFVYAPLACAAVGPALARRLAEPA
jgi:hypothetical protein